MRHYCTLFDSRYLAQGLVLYESLKKHSSEDFRLYILSMDDECHQALKWLGLDGVISLDVFEKALSLYRVRNSRSWTEYCWTLASIFTDSLLTAFPRSHADIPSMTYLDADLMFFSDPKVIFDEIGERSIAVIPHRLAENKDKARLSQNGKFNVSWVTFKNNAIGRECLSRWAAQCRERCSAEIGCGDQVYLDEWPARYGDELCVIQNIGAGVAPWNVSSYDLCYILENWNRYPFVNDKQLVFYHFHEYVHGERLTNYRLTDKEKRIIYEPYIAEVDGANKRIQEIRVSA